MIKDLKVANEIKENYCIGCGVCSATGDNEIALDQYGKFQLSSDINSEYKAKKIVDVCPFSNNNEDEIANHRFKNAPNKDEILGKYLNNFIGYAKDENIRMKAGSGGIITWLLLKLLEKKIITDAVFVGPSNDGEMAFEYIVSCDREEIKRGASSKYYPVELSSVLSHIKENDGRYAIVALPCFAKGLRLLQRENSIFENRIKFVISPFCGHLKTVNYAKFLAWQKDIMPEELESINFRKKIKGKRASQYGTKFLYNNKERTIENTSFKMGTNWGHGMFKYPACDFCDDIVGEVADISVGDAWLKKYTKDYKGNSAVVIRNREIDNLIKDSLKKDELNIEYVGPEIIKESQAGGIRHKREDLKYRLALKKEKNEWYPPKRVKPEKKHLTNKRKKIIELRSKISTASHSYYLEAIEDKQIQVFFNKMRPLLMRYEILYSGVINFLKRFIKSFLK